MYQIRNYDQLIDYQEKLGIFHMDLTLGRVKDFWRERGRPNASVIHVVGTNGKGSTATFFEALARNHGFRTGLFTSPHFVSPRERVLVDARPLTEEQWVAYANTVLSTPGGERLTYFEFQACLAMVAFEDLKVDVAVMEAGMGGRFDAITALDAEMVLFAPIGMDHELYLGDTLEKIATDKAGALRPGGPAITGPQAPEALEALRRMAAECGARLAEVAEPLAEDRPLGLSGPHQRHNAALALAGWAAFAERHAVARDEERESLALAQAFIPGRFQRVALGEREYILDGAHNEHAMTALAEALRAEGVRPGGIIFMCMGDKRLEPMLPILLGMSDGPVAVPEIPGERAAEPQYLVGKLGERATAVESLSAALVFMDSVPSPVLICGSLYLAAEFYTLHPRFLRRWNPVQLPSA